MSRVGDRVFADDEYVGVVEKEFICTWGRRKGRLHSIQVSCMYVTFKRIRVPGILYWSGTHKRWTNKLRSDVTYTLLRGSQVERVLA